MVVRVVGVVRPRNGDEWIEDGSDEPEDVDDLAAESVAEVDVSPSDEGDPDEEEREIDGEVEGEMKSGRGERGVVHKHRLPEASIEPHLLTLRPALLAFPEHEIPQINKPTLYKGGRRKCFHNLQNE